MRMGFGFGLNKCRDNLLGVEALQAALFASGEQGILLDLYDQSTLFQDAAGTTPVTALGQPVGKILDKSGRGNHATQATAASRPTVEARVNLTTNSEGAAATWYVTNVVDASTPIAGFSASLQFGDNAVARLAYKAVTLAAGTLYTTSIYVQMDDGNAPVVGVNGTSGDFAVFSDNVINTEAVSVRQIAGSLYRVSAARTATVGGVFRNCGVVKYSTHSARTFRVIGIQVEEGSAVTTYQRVNTATDYADVGAPRYLQFDGIDDGMVTPSIDFTGTDKVTVWAGVRKLSDVVPGLVVELSASLILNAGTFYLAAPQGVGTTTYAFESRGSITITNITASATAPDTSVIVGVGDISGDIELIRRNGAQAGVSTADQGTGNYGNYPLYIGRRGGVAYPFNGRLYQLIVRGAASSDGQIAAGEAWCNSKTRAY